MSSVFRVSSSVSSHLVGSARASMEHHEAVRYEPGWWLSPRGPRLRTHCWSPHNAGPQAFTVLVLHGLGSHGAFPTIRLLAAALVSSCCCSVLSLDFEGCESNVSPPRFVLGSSLGGGLALRVALESPSLFCGAVLLSPLVVIAEEAKPPSWAVGTLRLLSCIAPTLALLGGSSSDSALQYASVDMRDACEEDEKRYKGKMRLGTASALLELSSHLDERLGSVQIPFLALHGTDDKVVHVSSSRRLLKEAASEDAQLIEYEGARHTLLAEHPQRRAEIMQVIADWLLARVARLP